MNFYVDAYLAYNLGDDLFVKIMSESFPSAYFTVNYYGKYSRATFGNDKNILFPQYSLPLRVLNRLHIYDYINDAERLSNKYDGFILLGGSIFREEFYWQDVYDQRLRIIDAFRKKGKPVFVIGANFGPVQTQRFIDRYVELFRLCTDVCFRDKYSYNLFSALSNVRLERDIVFQYIPQKKHQKDNLIGISLIDPNHVPSISAKREAYKELLSAAIKDYTGKGFRCKLFAFCKAEGDEKIATEIKNMLSESERESVEIVVYDGHIDSFVTEISECSILMASRFHANVLGLLVRVHLIPLVYSDKTTNMLRDSSFWGEIIDVSTVGPDTRIIDKEYIHTFPEEEYRKSAQRQFAVLSEYISL